VSFLAQLMPHLQRPLPTDQARRLFHGRGHAYADLHHVTVDWLPPVALITLFSPENPADVLRLAEELAAAMPNCESVQVQHRFEKAGPVEVVWGKEISDLALAEGELKFHLRLGQARNTGLFLDMRTGRDWVRQHSRGLRVLNLFAYTCGFSVAAVAGGARSVLNVDMSSAALSVGRDNHHLNRQSLDTVGFERLDIFKSFGRLKKRGPFDLLICDPPTFQKGSVDIERDYAKILRRLDQFMAPGATLMLCLNAPKLSRDFLVGQVIAWAPEYGLSGEILPPAVFVEAEQKGLKVLLFRNEVPGNAQTGRIRPDTGTE
jgi:23S rRNA (cytosine1962-C5)-methyltransferase